MPDVEVKRLRNIIKLTSGKKISQELEEIFEYCLFSIQSFKKEKNIYKLFLRLTLNYFNIIYLFAPVINKEKKR